MKKTVIRVLLIAAGILLHKAAMHFFPFLGTIPGGIALLCILGGIYFLCNYQIKKKGGSNE
jgi:hypothetical protein